MRLTAIIHGHRPPGLPVPIPNDLNTDIHPHNTKYSMDPILPMTDEEEDGEGDGADS